MIGWKLGDRLKTAFHSYAQIATFAQSLGLAFPLLVLAFAYVLKMLKQGKKPITHFKNTAAGDVVFAFNGYNHWPLHY